MTRIYETDLERAKAAQQMLGEQGYIAGIWHAREIEQNEKNRLRRRDLPRPQCTAAHDRAPRQSLHPAVRAISGGKP